MSNGWIIICCIIGMLIFLAGGASAIAFVNKEELEKEREWLRESEYLTGKIKMQEDYIYHLEKLKERYKKLSQIK